MTEQELANVIWDIKEIIRNLYDDAEVEDVILPFTLLRRLDCVLDQHRESVMAELAGTDEKMIKYKLKAAMKKANISFFNTSGLSLEKLLAAPGQLNTNFETYLNGFTDNVKDILAQFVHEDNDSDSEEVDLSKIYSRLHRNDVLFSVTQRFVQEVDLHPDKVSNSMMGTVFEIVIRRSKESTNTKAGQFYTPREIVRLLVSLTMAGKEANLHTPGKMFSIYDPCCGTGGMLTAAKEYLQEKAGNPDLKVYLYGQELNEKTYAICKSDLLMKGDNQDLDNQLFCGNTLSNDMLPSATFQYMLANPPFGVDWGKTASVKQAVEKDNAVGRRFEAGLPSSSDGSLLFLQHMIYKMDPAGARIGIVLNGSPLFNGDAGSGWSNIRKMLLDRNLLDCIVALPKNLFYGTDISTYLWIIDNNRPAEKAGKVLFINAAHAEYTTLLQKNLGKKRFEISEAGAADILQIYKDYVGCSREIVYEKTGEKESLEVAKLLDYDDLLYTSVAVRRPLRLWFENITEKYAAMCADAQFKADDKKNAIYKEIASLPDVDRQRSDLNFFQMLKDNGIKYTAAQVASIRASFGTVSEDAPVAYANPLKPYTGKTEEGRYDNYRNYKEDGNLNDTEKIPMKVDIDEYFRKEVLHFVGDAWMERDKDKVGCEIPFTKLFYVYRPLRSLESIMAELKALDGEMMQDLDSLMKEV